MGLWKTGIYLMFYLYCFMDKGFDSQIAKSVNLIKEGWVDTVAPMEALDAVKEIYASNFEKVLTVSASDNYYYKLEDADYYLYYEGTTEDDKYYLIHLYEFVLDEPDTGIGHTVTYGWYRVDTKTGKILEYTE